MEQLAFDYRGYVGHMMRKYRIGEEQAVDAYTDALIKLRQQVVSDAFRGESKLSTFFFTIYSRKCIDSLRKSPSHAVELTDELLAVPDGRPDAEHYMIEREAYEQLLALMDELGSLCKAVLMDRYYRGITNMQEIADRNGLKNANTAGSQRYTCLKKLMERIKEQGHSIPISATRTR